MNCKTCEYPLWNLTARQCPECGTPFKPSDYEFALNSVRFCCPDCLQPYYGTGDKGHLVPTAFACVRCGRAVEMDSMILLPTEGVKESQTKADEMPWLVRKKIGRFKAWFATMGRAMADPGRLVELVPDNRPASEAIAYAVVTNIVFLLTNLGVFFLPGMLLPSLGRGQGTGLSIAIGIVSAIALVILLPLVVVLLWGAMTHLILLVTGETKHPIARTYHAIGYSAGTNVLLGIPCMFMLSPLAAIWWIITAGLMLHRAQSLKAWRSTLAIALPPGVLVAGAIGLIVLTISGRATAARAARTQAQVAAAQAQAAANAAELTNFNAVAAGLFAMRNAEGGDWPAHGLQLLANGSVLPNQFTGMTSRTMSLTPDWSIEAIAPMNKDQLAQIAAQCAASLPANVIAHRVGDVVFTYHGIDPAGDGAGDLWIAVEASEGAYFAPLRVAYSDGRTGVLPADACLEAISTQNQLRGEHGLAPLPDPRTLKQQESAIGP